jgi:adenylate cyclase
VSEAGAPEDTAGALERLVALGDPTLDNAQVCEMAGADRDVADRLWRALGFPDVPEAEPAFTEQDARALRLATEGLEPLTGEQRAQALELMLHEARVISASLANLAEAELEAIGDLTALGLRGQLIAQAVERGLEHSDFGWLILYVLRRQLQAALGRRIAVEASDGRPRQRLAVGFVDLVGFTELSRRLTARQLGQVLGRFESHVFDVVTEAGGRVVKLIGDEAMIVCSEPAPTVRAAIEILAGTGKADLPRARAGIAAGELLLQGGDYFGATVNLASRIVDRAPPCALIVDESVAKALEGERDLKLESLPSTQLKGIGEVPLWRVARAESCD